MILKLFFGVHIILKIHAKYKKSKCLVLNNMDMNFVKKINENAIFNS